MKRIWAPWRMEYIEQLAKGNKKKSQSREACVFCKAQKGKPSPKNLVLYKGETCFVIMNKYPYINGHLMVIPFRHLSDYSKLTLEEHCEMGILMDLSMRVLKKVCKAQAFNLGMNLGEVAGAGIREHLHYHIVPRWSGDHNYIPVVADLRVIMEHLGKTHQKLIGEFDRCAKKYQPLSSGCSCDGSCDCS
ncbi:MAG: HIT domain-containing protein [Deltaproteobacteria bacterium]|nr:HIT domain-containing protein [Deltaproteobacteria bacterium]